MAKYTKSVEWWSARRGTRPASRSAFGAIGDLSSGMMVGSVPAGYAEIARWGDLIYLSYPMNVAAIGPWANPLVMGSKLLPAGSVRCDNATFGVSGGSGWKCAVRTSDAAIVQNMQPPPGDASHVADENQGFRTDTNALVYFKVKGHPNGMVRQVNPGSYMCNVQNFGPLVGRIRDDYPSDDLPAECLLAPLAAVEQGAPMTYYDDLARQYEAMQRAEAAAQAQRDMVAAQDRVFADRQAADYAAQQAQIAQNAQAQEAAALAAAEMYRQAQQQAQQQAAQYAAELAALAAANASDIDAAMAAGEMAAQAEALRQALAQAQAHEAEQRAAYDMANAATQAEMRNQEQANARVDAAEAAADQAAANAAAGGASSPFANLSTTEMLMYGGIAAAAIYLLMGEKKAAQ
jgi:hypothetical protein